MFSKTPKIILSIALILGVCMYFVGRYYYKIENKRREYLLDNNKLEIEDIGKLENIARNREYSDYERLLALQCISRIVDNSKDIERIKGMVKDGIIDRLSIHLKSSDREEVYSVLMAINSFLNKYREMRYLLEKKSQGIISWYDIFFMGEESIYSDKFWNKWEENKGEVFYRDFLDWWGKRGSVYRGNKKYIIKLEIDNKERGIEIGTDILGSGWDLDVYIDDKFDKEELEKEKKEIKRGNYTDKETFCKVIEDIISYNMQKYVICNFIRGNKKVILRIYEYKDRESARKGFQGDITQCETLFKNSRLIKCRWKGYDCVKVEDKDFIIVEIYLGNIVLKCTQIKGRDEYKKLLEYCILRITSNKR